MPALSSMANQAEGGKLRLGVDTADADLPEAAEGEIERPPG